MHLLCSCVPAELNIQNIAKSSGISRNTLYSYFYYLQKANLIEIIGGNYKNKKLLNKPDKILLENINLYNILCDTQNIGNLRESFFVSQTKIYNQVKYSNIGDFKVNDKYIFEVGGKNKNFKQIKDIEDSFIIADDIEIGFGNKIPLYILGFFIKSNISVNSKNELKIKSPFVPNILFENNFINTKAEIQTFDYVEIEKNKFKLIGRSSKIFKIAGKRYSTIQIENILEEIYEIQKALVFVENNDDKLRDEILNITLESKKEFSSKEIKNILKEKISNLKFSLKLNYVDKIAINSIGKKLKIN